MIACHHSSRNRFRCPVRLTSAVASRLAVVLAVASVSGAAGLGCSGSGTDCTAAANNAVALIRADLEREASNDADTGERQNKESMLPALKEELVKYCKTERWDDTVRECIATAKTTGALEACDPDKKLGEATGAAAPANEDNEPTDLDETPSDGSDVAPK